MSRALVFPGQGAQYVGMGVELAQRFPAARALLSEADRVLGFALSDIMANGPESDLTRTDVSQPAIFVASAMSLAVAEEALQPLTRAACAGLSLGEYTALYAAGAIGFAEALRLVRLRGQAMQAAAEATPGGMVALIGADEAQARALCAEAAAGEVLTVANLNSPGQVVISGARGACVRALELAKKHGIRRATSLAVAGAFHSPLMQPAAERLAEAVAALSWRDPQRPVYSNVTAAPLTRASEIPELLVRQLTSPVRWADSVRALHAAGISEFLELGPGKTLCGMIARTVEGVQCRNLDTAEDVRALVAAGA
ncbi:MAG: ACP S-malonyltransferase [Planctomycetota bacterium]|nr:ACP S-malonyltransferase [Planctomycetota bacterium]MCX8040553.1 ACP S-malonyltransferase [Planctomycetota bacterium]MDW8372360.1 ACP S-malonyltransferase [Planctomycetota bacterium]